MSVSSRTDAEVCNRHGHRERDEPSAFESQSQESTVAATKNTETISNRVETRTFENQPLVSRVDTSCHGEQIRTEEVQSVLKPRGCLAAGRHPQDIARLVPTRLAEKSARSSVKGSCKQGPVTRTTAREAHKRVAEWTAAEQLVVETASKQQSAKVEKSTEEDQKPVEGQNAVRNCSPDEYEPSSNSSAVSLCTS